MKGTTANRVVVDTNVFVGAAFNRASASAEVIQWVRDRRVSMPWTDWTFREVRHVLRKIPPISWDAFEDLFRPDDQWPGPLPEEDLEWVSDPEDRKFAALARATEAVLISNDHHLVDRRAEASFTVLTPGEYVERTNPAGDADP